jgi:Spx/MgsR family transcriptional regulator
MTTLFGIHNCDTIKKAQKWLDKSNVAYTFHDFRKDGLTESILNDFILHVDWTDLLNKRSTTYRNLEESIKNNLTQETAISAMLEQPTLIKRPVLVSNGKVTIGFKEATYQEIFK